MSEERKPERRIRTPRTARGTAWQVLNRVEVDGAWADRALHAAFRDADLSRRDRAFATELTYGSLRLRGRIDALLAMFLDRPIEELETGVRNLLRLGTYQLIAVPGLRPATAVDEAVKLAQTGGFKRASPLVNAVLRSVSEGHAKAVFPTLDSDPVGHVSQYGSLPAWIAERLVEQLGPAEATAFALAMIQAPPRTIRLTPNADAENVARRLEGTPCRYAPDAMNVKRDPVGDPAFGTGEISIQDEASQLVARLVDAQPGETVIDCCSAPGGKTAQLAQQVGAGGEVIALELRAARLALVRRELQRVGAKSVRVLERDATKPFDLQGRLHFPRILVDAPCSGLGTLRRNPDMRWNVKPGDVERSAQTQANLLENAARYVEDDGVLVYSVCTVTPEETTGVVAQFLEKHPEMAIEDPRPYLPESAHELVDESGALRTWTHLHGCDSFYAVRFLKSPRRRR